ELAVDELAVRLLLVVDVLPHLEDDVVLAGGGVGVFVGGLGAGGGRGDDLTVAAHLPLKAEAPVVGYVASGDLAAFEADLGVRRGVELLLHGGISGGGREAAGCARLADVDSPYHDAPPV